MLLKDRVAIITGGATGMGRAIAIKFAEEGCSIAIADINEKEANDTLSEVLKKGTDGLVIQCDVTNEEQVKSTVKKVLNKFGKIDILVNNAGITIWARFEEMQALDPFEAVMRVNYLGSLYCTYYALPYLKESQGRIVAVSSLAGKTGVPFRSAYSASKFAMAGFFETLRIEVVEHGVSVTIIYPDYVQTDTRLQAFGPDGKPLAKRPLREGRMTTVEVAAE